MSVTVFAPIFAQLKLSGSTVVETIGQLAVLPASISEGVIVATQLLSSQTVSFLHKAFKVPHCGSQLPLASIVTEAEQLPMLPD